MTNKTVQFNKPVSLVMVAYNEENHIERVVCEYYNEIYIKLPKQSEFIVYLDKPTDNTSKIVKNLAKKIDIIVLEGKKNLGYSKATTAAFKTAKNDIIFYSDSSGKHHAKDFWNLAKYESKYDVISGLRIKRSDPFIRRIITFFQRIIISSMFLMPFYDFNTGFKLIHRNIIENVLDDCKYMKQCFSSELLIRAYKKGYSIKNVPVTFTKRISKNSGTRYLHLPGIILRSLVGFLLLRLELFIK